MKLTRYDLSFLSALYKYRALTIRQCFLYFFSRRFATFKDFYHKYVVPLVKFKLVDLRVGKRNGYALTLTQKSLDLLVKYAQLPSEIYDIDNDVVIKTLTKISDITVTNRYVDHQTEMNEFLLQFSLLACRQKIPNVQVYDEKFLSNYVNIRPDSLIRIGDLDLFVEQDMGTETLKQLNDKWNRYRRFLNFEFDSTGKRKIVVCFIVSCNGDVLEKRKDLIRRSIQNTFDTLLSEHFDIFIGTRKELLRMVFDLYLNVTAYKSGWTYQDTVKTAFEKHGFKMHDGRALKMKLDGTSYQWYLAKTDTLGHLSYFGNSKTGQGRFQEFLCDDYRYSPVSVISKIAFHHRNAKNFDIAYSTRHPDQRLIGYIVVVENLGEIYHHLKTVKLIGVRNVFFTTIPRLMTFELPHALLSFGRDGKIYSCSDEYFEANILEGDADDLGIDGIEIED